MIADRSWGLFLACCAMTLVQPAYATITITSNEIWDGVQNPHAADGVVLTTTGSGGSLVSTYTIPTGITIASGATVYLHDPNAPSNFTQAVNWNFNPNAGPLTFGAANSTIDTTKGGRNQALRTFTMNMNNNNIVGATAGAGRIINGVYVVGGLTGDSLSLAINSNANVAVGTIDLTKNDAVATKIDIMAQGLIDIDNIADADISAGGGNTLAVDISGNSLLIGNVNTQALRSPGANVPIGNVNLRALAQPANDVGNFNGNTFAQNTVTLDGFINTNSTESGNINGNLTVSGVKVTLAPTFGIDLNESALFTVNAGDAANGFTQGQLFVNNSTVTPNAVNYSVFHDGFGPPAVAWATNTTGNWSNSASWTPNSTPNATNMVATLGSAITEPQTIFLNSSVTVKGLVFDTTSKVAVGGPASITLQSNAGNATLSVLQGTHDIQVPLALLSNTMLTTSAGTVLDLDGVLNLNGKTLTLSGSGQVHINNLVTGMGSIANGGSLGTGGGPANLAGDFTNTGTLEISIGGSKQSDIDAWSVTGNAQLSGILDIDLINGFVPAAGQLFTVFLAADISADSLVLGGPDAAYFNLIKTPTSIVLQSAVPEPGMAALMFIASIVGVFGRRHRDRR